MHSTGRPVSGCVPIHQHPCLPLLRTEALWGGMIFQFSSYMLLKMQLILKTEMMDAMVIHKYIVIALMKTQIVSY